MTMQTTYCDCDATGISWRMMRTRQVSQTTMNTSQMIQMTRTTNKIILSLWVSTWLVIFAELKLTDNVWCGIEDPADLVFDKNMEKVNDFLLKVREFETLTSI